MSKHWTSANMPAQDGRVAVVTGANSGIGYEAAKALAAKGARVVLACRSAERGQAALARLRAELPEAQLELRLLDLANLASVETFAEGFLADHDRLDLLINNAGVMMPPERQETADGFELQIGVNHLGHFALTLRLVELLMATDGARVVNVSSSAQNFGDVDLSDLHWTERRFKKMASYAASKTANMLFTLELQRRFEEVGASTLAVACHPGWTATNLQRTATTFRLLNPLMAMKPWQGALPTLYAAVADVTPGGYYGPDGLGNMRGYPAANAPAKHSLDAPAARRLWELSEAAVGLNAPALAQRTAA